MKLLLPSDFPQSAPKGMEWYQVQRNSTEANFTCSTGVRLVTLTNCVVPSMQNFDSRRFLLD